MGIIFELQARLLPVHAAIQRGAKIRSTVDSTFKDLPYVCIATQLAFKLKFSAHGTRKLMTQRRDAFRQSVSLFGIRTGKFSSIISAASVFAASAFRDVKRVGIISAPWIRPPTAVVSRDDLLRNIAVYLLHGLDRIGMIRYLMNPPVAHRILCNLNYQAFFMPSSRDFCYEII